MSFTAGQHENGTTNVTVSAPVVSHVKCSMQQQLRCWMNCSRISRLPRAKHGVRTDLTEGESPNRLEMWTMRWPPMNVGMVLT